MDGALWPVVLLLSGLALLVLELFLPTGGLLGVFAVVSIVAGVVVGFGNDTSFGTVLLVVALVAAPTVLAVGVHFWPKTPLGRRILGTPPADDLAERPGQKIRAELDALVGKVGTAISAMRPSGTVRMRQKVYDAVADGMAIEIGQHVRATAVRHNRLIVVPCERNPDTGTRETSEDFLSQSADAFGEDPFEDPLA